MMLFLLLTSSTTYALTVNPGYTIADICMYTAFITQRVYKCNCDKDTIVFELLFN